MLVAHVTCMLYVKVITYNDIHLPIDPMYHNVAVLFITRYTVVYGKSISVINKKTFWLEMSVCNFFGWNEDIFVNILNISQYYTLC